MAKLLNQDFSNSEAATRPAAMVTDGGEGFRNDPARLPDRSLIPYSANQRLLRLLNTDWRCSDPPKCDPGPYNAVRRIEIQGEAGRDRADVVHSPLSDLVEPGKGGEGFRDDDGDDQFAR